MLKLALGGVFALPLAALAAGYPSRLGEAVRRRAAAAFALFSFVSSGTALIPHPGLWTDEAVHGQMAVNWLTIPNSFSNIWDWGPRSLWMKDSYQGSLKAFILAGSFFFFGISPFVLRATTLLTGAAALLFLVLFAARRFGAAWGAAFALLVVADPAFVTAVVYDTGPVAVSLALKSLALWLLASSEESPRAWPRRLAAGVALGMCVWDKSHSLWLLLAAPAAAWLLPRGKRAEAGAQIFAGALIGAAPWLIYNAVNPFITFRDPGNQGWTLAAHFGRIVYWLGMRLGLLAAALTGRGSLTMVAGEPMSPALAPALLVSTFLGASAFLVWRRGPGSREGLTEAGRWLGLSTAIFGFALLSPVPVKWHHLMLLWPFPQFALIAILRGLPVSRRSRSVRISVVALCLLPAAFDLGALNAFRNETIRDRGGRMFAEAVRDAAAWIGAREASRPGTVVLCGYALAAPVAVYSAGRAVCSDADPEFLSHLQTAAPQMAAGDLLWTSPVMDYGGWQGESAALVELNERIPHERAAVFLDAANRPLVEIFRSASRDARSLREDLAAVHASVPASRSREDADVLPAYALFAAGRKTHARELLETVFSRQRSVEGRRRVAIAFQDMGLPARAASILEVESRMRPSDAFLRLDLDVAKALSGRREAAISDLKILCALHPALSEARVTYAELQLESGRPSEAAAALSGRCGSPDGSVCAAWWNLLQRADRRSGLR